MVKLEYMKFLFDIQYIVVYLREYSTYFVLYFQEAEDGGAKEGSIFR